MGYNTQFQGSLTFKKEPTIEELNKLETFFGEDCRNHPEWGNTELTYIDFELDSENGICWDGSEKTYDLVEKVNLIIKNMQKEFPDFELKGQLLAQGERFGDVWRLVMIDNKAIRVDNSQILQFSKEDIIKISMYFLYDLAELGYLNSKGLDALNFGKLKEKDLKEFSSNINICLKELQEDGYVIQ